MEGQHKIHKAMAEVVFDDIARLAARPDTREETGTVAVFVMPWL
jgi:hypothetical protein